jgi:hypothetical protein
MSDNLMMLEFMFLSFTAGYFLGRWINKPEEQKKLSPEPKTEPLKIGDIVVCPSRPYDAFPEELRVVGFTRDFKVVVVDGFGRNRYYNQEDLAKKI